MMSELIAPGSSMPMLRGPMSSPPPRCNRLCVLCARTPRIQCILKAFAQTLAIRILCTERIANRNEGIQHRLIAAHGTPAPLNCVDPRREEFLEAVYIEPCFVIDRLARTHKGDPVERTCRTADILDECASNVVEHFPDGRVRRQLGEALLCRRKPTRHVQTVIPISGLCVHRCKVVLLRHNCGDDRIHRIPNICHLIAPTFHVIE